MWVENLGGRVDWSKYFNIWHECVDQVYCVEK